MRKTISTLAVLVGLLVPSIATAAPSPYRSGIHSSAPAQPALSTWS